jgi:acetoin utilization protein AcuB
MFVADRMSRPVITVPPTLPIQDALSLMRKEKVSRLPVVDRRGRLVGIVSEKDLLHAAPSSATSLSVWELSYLLSKVTVEEIMTRQVITISGDTPIEEAARVMSDNSIHGLPVMKKSEVVGMITANDIFRLFLELLGAREPGVRMTILVRNIPGEYSRITRAIFDAGGNIVALSQFLGESTENRHAILKVEGVDELTLRKVVTPLVVRLVDSRTMKPG